MVSSLTSPDLGRALEWGHVHMNMGIFFVDSLFFFFVLEPGVTFFSKLQHWCGHVMLFKGTYRQKWAKVRPKGHEMENMWYFYWENCIFIRCAHVRTFRKARSASKRFVSATKWRLETFVSNYLSEKETIKNDKSDPNIFKILISCTVEGQGSRGLSLIICRLIYSFIYCTKLVH